MRVAFVNGNGHKMLVDESRVEEYKAAGFKLAVEPLAKEEKQAEPKPKRTKRNKEV
ncbi:MAG: hypothetical protein KBT03_10835 [Bacteroidales bacterium]|nr:hypothetical protein [Candidatus Scybalousia scybalohippi]